jgi:ferredoxin
MDLKKLTVLPQGIDVMLPKGSPLTDIEFETPQRMIAFGCRSGACGACVIEVVEGVEALGEADDVEREFLADLGHSEDNHRLACQCQLWTDATIRAVG